MRDNHTYWHLGDLDRAYAACTPGTFGLDAMILARWGRREEAIALQRKRDATLPPTSRTLAAAHRAAIADDRAECIRLSAQAIAMCAAARPNRDKTRDTWDGT
jgi:hypothetical protein